MYSETKGEEKDYKYVYVLILVIVILLSVLFYFLLFNKKKSNCDKCDAPIEEEYQLINYQGFIFEKPLNWNFLDENDNYIITDDQNRIYISLETTKDSYESFIDDNYQASFIETIQTSDNIKIDKIKKEDNYYLYEGVFNNYNYLIVAVGNNSKVVLIKTQFVDQITYNKEKKNVIDFSLSCIKKSES